MILERKCLKFAVVILALVIGMPGTAEVRADTFLVKHSFTYFYNDGKGDYYKGSVYASKNYYDPSRKYYWTDENGARGYYAITDTVSAASLSSSYQGKVYVDSYYDQESNKTYAVPNKSEPKGYGYLGTEFGTIIGIARFTDDYVFGRKNSYVHYEADLPELWKNYFTFTYGNGDYYKGYVFAASSYGYRTGTTKYYTDSNGQKAYYKITGGEKIGPVLGSDSRIGQVYVTRYFDKETNYPYTPVAPTVAKGSYFLGSETGYISKKEGDEDCRFGAVRQNGWIVRKEADLPLLYKNYFRFDYGSGDYYTGYVFAASSWGYRNGKIYYVTDENGGKAKYTITGGAYIGYVESTDSRLGQVFVSQYYDAETKKFPNLVKPGEAKGRYYLGSEFGYIIASTDVRYFFGSSNHYEADLTVAVSPGGTSDLWKNYFTYSYGNGDSYQGYVYALSSYGYRYGKKYYNTDENGQLGVYTITGGTKIGSVSSTDARLGKVFVDTYYDKESDENYTPIKVTEVKGLGYLGSEWGYILKESLEFAEDLRFGAGGHFKHAEADLPILYKNSFTYKYSNGDYYKGYVYATSSYGYRTGKISYTTDEHGRCAYYTITGGTSPEVISPDDARLGKVYVSTYYDKESNKTYSTSTSTVNPDANGHDYLGSETGYMFPSSSLATVQFNRTEIDYYFGRGQEADLPVLYKNYFTFTYGNGDYYKGYVYAASSYGYRTGSVFYRTDENGNCGFYKITGGDNLKMVPVTESRFGKITVTQYYDKERNKNYPILAQTYYIDGWYLGYLGSETGFIYRTDSLACRFGSYNGRFYEADAGYGYYYFNYYYDDGSGDYYSGYLKEINGLMKVGAELRGTAQPMGADTIKGHYKITRYDDLGEVGTEAPGKMWIYRYYDGDTKKISNRFNSSTSISPAVARLSVTNRHNGPETGFVNDPSVPVTDAYFGNYDVTYGFGPNTNGNKINFLAFYHTNLRYWDQPTVYKGSCAEVAAAIVLSYWDSKSDLFKNLIESDWQKEWPDNTKDTSSYKKFISNLNTVMGRLGIYFIDLSTDIEKIGPGLKKYALSKSYNFEYKDYINKKDGLVYNLASYWSNYISAIKSHPVILQVTYKKGTHTVTARGYWNNGYVVANMGYGTAKTNAKLEWNWKGSNFSDHNVNPDGGYIFFMTDFFPATTGK